MIPDFIPNTEAEDGDPLDVLVLTDEPTFSGCQVDCHVLGVIEPEQEQAGNKNRNDRLIAVAQQSILYSGLKQLSELNPLLLTQIEVFFINYQKVRDIEFKILACQGAGRALEIVSSGRSKRRLKLPVQRQNATSNDPSVPYE
jgi:inorganic pyrophosphatase